MTIFNQSASKAAVNDTKALKAILDDVVRRVRKAAPDKGVACLDPDSNWRKQQTDLALSQSICARCLFANGTRRVRSESGENGEEAPQRPDILEYLRVAEDRAFPSTASEWFCGGAKRLGQ